MEKSEISFFPNKEDSFSEKTAAEISEEKERHDRSIREGEEELSEEFIVAEKKRLRVIFDLEKLFDNLETVGNYEDKEDAVREVREFIDKNEKVISREDGSGSGEVKRFRRRLNNFKIGIVSEAA